MANDTMLWLPDWLLPVYQFSPWLLLFMMATAAPVGVFCYMRPTLAAARPLGALLAVVGVYLWACLLWPAGALALPLPLSLLSGHRWPWW